MDWGLIWQKHFGMHGYQNKKNHEFVCICWHFQKQKSSNECLKASNKKDISNVLSKGSLISKGIFNFVPSSAEMNRNHFSQLFSLLELNKLRMVIFWVDGTKMKKSSEIKPPLKGSE